jgi:hypothetical protein
LLVAPPPNCLGPAENRAASLEKFSELVGCCFIEITRSMLEPRRKFCGLAHPGRPAASNPPPTWIESPSRRSAYCTSLGWRFVVCIRSGRTWFILQKRMGEILKLLAPVLWCSPMRLKRHTTKRLPSAWECKPAIYAIELLLELVESIIQPTARRAVGAADISVFYLRCLADSCANSLPIRDSARPVLFSRDVPSRDGHFSRRPTSNQNPRPSARKRTN